MKKILPTKPITKFIKIISIKGKEVTLFVIEKIKQGFRFIMKKWRESYQNNPKATLGGTIGILILLIIVGYVVYNRTHPEEIATIPYPFEEIDSKALLNSNKPTWNWGNLNSDIRNYPSKLETYYAQIKPFTSLQSEEKINELTKTLGFTDDVRQYVTDEGITYQEADKSMNIDLIGSRLSFSIGLNVDESILKEATIQPLENRIETANMFLTNFGLYPDYIDNVQPEMSFAKMEDLGLVEIIDPTYADTTIYLYKASFKSYEIEQSALNTYIVLTNSGKIVSFASNNKEFINQVNSPLKSQLEIKESLKNNQGVILENILDEFTSPQSIIVNTISLVYYYNEITQYVSPVFKAEVTLTSGEETVDSVVYVPAYKDVYYTNLPVIQPSPTEEEHYDIYR